MEFSVEFTAIRKGRSSVEARVSLSEKDIRDLLDYEIESALRSATYDGATVKATIEADLSDAISDYIESGHASTRILDSDLDGDEGEWEDIDIDSVEPIKRSEEYR